MKKYFTLLTILIIASTIVFGQRPTMVLTFTALNNINYVQLDSIKVMNRTQGGDTVLYWPDTVLVLDFATGIPEDKIDDQGFQVFQNYPNPVSEQTIISLYIPEKDRVSIIVTDILGRVNLQTNKTLDMGTHTFRFTPGSGNLYFFTVQWQGHSSIIKILNLSSGKNAASLEYIESEPVKRNLKAMKDLQEFVFSPGDELLCIGYAYTLQSGIPDIPDTSHTYTFQFATNIPCPGTPTVEYEGKVYNTVQIFSQCWLKENLDAGIMIPAEQNMADNDTIEKFCYNNEPDSCTKYGGLYQWDEMMQYTTQPGPQGICPEGWHLPADEEWKVLEGAVDSHYRIGDSEWDDYDSRGYDAGDHLKAVEGWIYGGGGDDQYGFSALPGGMYIYGSMFGDVLFTGHWWTSSEYGDFPWVHSLHQTDGGVNRFSGYYIRFGISVRCLRDEAYIPIIELSFTAVNNTAHVQLDSIKVMNRTQGGETMLYGLDTTLLLPIELLFNPGDELLYIGYANTLQSGMLDTPEESTTCTFQFATNIPCPGTPTVEYEGQTYNTIQIFSQCWLKENLNVGAMIQGNEEMTDNDTIEKYCYNNEPDSCNKYGGLYQWNEMMQYTTQQGLQGICPPGWHIPTDEEWKVLEGAVDSQYGIGDPEWELENIRGTNSGRNLKSANEWLYGGGGTDIYGFSALPGGGRWIDGSYGTGGIGIGINGLWWTSTEDIDDHAWIRHLDHDVEGTTHVKRSKNIGPGVRCLRDE